MVAAFICVVGVAFSVPAGASPDKGRSNQPASYAVAPVWPLDIRAATVHQDGLNIVFSVRTSGTISASTIGAQAGRSLCFNLFRAKTGNAVRRICLALSANKARIVRENLNLAGAPTSRSLIGNVSISRPSPNRLIARIPASGAGLAVGAYRWQAASTWVDSAGCRAPGCADRVPATPAQTKYAAATPVGCVATGTSVRSNGPRGHKVVAISFDDGPSKYTPSVLNLLRHYKAHATFFEVGNQMSGRAALQRRILAEGNGLADHSWSHPVLSGGGSFASSEVSRTKSRITSQTGYTPCLFRAPYGAISSTLVGIVRAQKMLTIQWDVDPTDWSRPGASAISSRVLAQTRPGSIILMHDGGGDRSQSVAAADTILRTLSRRGYRVVSVETLLGLKTLFR
ncbi:MAG: polysaccharide deacetylase family protein [Actinomycetes bacterium]